MRNRVYFDIETIPTDNQSVIDEIAKSINPPATHKKQETIDAWMAENKEAATKEAVHKTGLSGLYGRIACIGFAIDDEECQIVSQIGQGEADMINSFFESVSELRTTVFIGHNIAGFDLQFLKHRCIILGIAPPRSIKMAMTAKPWDDCINDTMLMWSSSSQERISQDKLAKALGLAGKTDMNGSMVADMWPQNPDKVVQYCRDDVEQNREIHKRLLIIHP